MVDLAGGIINEMKRHPYTSISALLCLMAVPVLFLNKADAGDVRALTAQIAEVRETVRRESTLAELRNVRRELFDINLRISQLEKVAMQVDDLLVQRREDLQAQQRRLEALLQAMDAKQRGLSDGS